MIHTSVCMITYNKLPFLQRSIRAIAGSMNPNIENELIVLDNGSDDGTLEFLKSIHGSFPQNIKYIVCAEPKNIGLNAYRTVTEVAKGKVIVTADDDIFSVQPSGWEHIFDEILSGTFGGKKFGYVGASTVNKDGGMIDEVWGHAESPSGLKIDVCRVGGWFSATTRDAMNSIGGFHSGMPEMYLEDADYQRRMWNAGYLCGITSDVRVLHARSPRYYKKYRREHTYREKARLAREIGINIEPLT